MASSEFRVLGLDVATTTGYAVWESGTCPVAFTHRSDASNYIDCAAHHAAVMVGLINDHSPRFAVLEGYGFASKMLVKSVTLGAILRYFLTQNGIPWVELAPNSLKLFITGAGNAPKERIILEVYKRWGLTAQSNDVADAIGLAYFGAALFDLVPQLPARSASVVNRVKLSKQFLSLGVDKTGISE